MTRIALAIGLALSCLATLAAAQTAQSDWEGWYVGLSLGHFDGDVTETATRISGMGPPGTDVQNYAYQGDGIVGGIYGGRNWQRGDMVYGVELRFQAGEEFAYEENEAPDELYFLENRGALSLNGRVGYAFGDNALIYGTAGLSAAKVRHNWTSGGVHAPFDETYTGYNVGIGLDYQLTQQSGLRLDVSYFALETADDAYTDLFPTRVWNEEIEHTVISVGYTYRFAK